MWYKILIGYGITVFLAYGFLWAFIHNYWNDEDGWLKDWSISIILAVIWPVTFFMWTRESSWSEIKDDIQEYGGFKLLPTFKKVKPNMKQKH